MIRVIFTADYEVFGNGTGCVDSCMIRPTKLLASTLEQHGARLTLFVDVCEYWAFEQAETAGILPQQEKPASLIKNQLQDLARRGHDIQLHFHPQWLDAVYDPQSGWQLNHDLWRLPSLPDGYGDVENRKSFLGLFSQGKATLEDIIKPVCPDYECVAFRAGAWSMQPESEILRAMHDAGLKFDSTVAPGCHTDDGKSLYDFRSAPLHRPVWPIHRKLVQPASDSPLKEVAIFTKRTSLLEKLSFIRTKLRATPPPGCSGTYEAISASPWNAKHPLWQFLHSKYSMLEYSIRDAKSLIRFMKEALSRYSDHSATILPLIAISHPKSFNNATALHQWLEWISRQEGVEADPLDQPAIWNLIS